MDDRELVRRILARAGVDPDDRDLDLVTGYVQRAPAPSRPRLATEPAVVPPVREWPRA